MVEAQAKERLAVTADLRRQSLLQIRPDLLSVCLADCFGEVRRIELEDGSVVEVKGNEEIEYDGETHTAANLFDALKEGYYGKF